MDRGAIRTLLTVAALIAFVIALLLGFGTFTKQGEVEPIADILGWIATGAALRTGAALL